MTGPGLEALVSDLPADIRTAVLDDPVGFLDAYLQLAALPEELFWLVDKNHSLSESYEPPDLVFLREYGTLLINREDLRLRELILPDLFRMVKAAREEGIDLLISSAYRSYSYQKQVFAYHVERLGREEAEKESAEPGKSQHQLGTTIDFGSITFEFALTEAGKWLAANARRYGFSLSYPEGYEELTGYIYEPWHYRYISPEGTRMERIYFGGIQQHMLEFFDAHSSDLEAFLVD